MYGLIGELVCQYIYRGYLVPLSHETLEFPPYI